MEIKREEIKSKAIKFTVEKDGKVAGRAYLYLIYNNLHTEPYGYLEDVFVEEDCRGQGLGGRLVKAAIAEAKARGCYKIIGTSRHSRAEVHEFYKKLGFEDYGKEFRKTLTK
ncbi:MAG: GNAT family N-acetyltransferase [Candidatus Magasanikbacteria bacterium]|nr:GNAT family N-acetyltransferase [Candidatus Magasanikbacteria bacterium]